jgi:hypothetical protein
MIAQGEKLYRRSATFFIRISQILDDKINKSERRDIKGNSDFNDRFRNGIQSREVQILQIITEEILE